MQAIAFRMANRLQRRAEAMNGYGREFFITDVCESIHGHVSGSSEGLSEKDFRDGVAFLKVCLETWEDGLVKFRGFDDAVKGLVLATLREVECR